MKKNPRKLLHFIRTKIQIVEMKSPAKKKTRAPKSKAKTKLKTAVKKKVESASTEENERRRVDYGKVLYVMVVPWLLLLPILYFIIVVGGPKLYVLSGFCLGYVVVVVPS